MGDFAAAAAPTSEATTTRLDHHKWLHDHFAVVYMCTSSRIEMEMYLLTRIKLRKSSISDGKVEIYAAGMYMYTLLRPHDDDPKSGIMDAWLDVWG